MKRIILEILSWAILIIIVSFFGLTIYVTWESAVEMKQSKVRSYLLEKRVERLEAQMEHLVKKSIKPIERQEVKVAPEKRTITPEQLKRIENLRKRIEAWK